MRLTHRPIYGPVHIHEYEDGRLFEMRRDHAFDPDIKLEWRAVRPDGTEFDAKWYPFKTDENAWDWLENNAPDLLIEIRDEVLEAA